MKEHGSLAEVVKFIKGKMAEKAAENAAIESESEPESEDGAMIVNSDGEEEPASPKKKAKPKKKKKTSAGMQIPEHWPWEEAKKLFIEPDVVKGDGLDVSAAVRNM
jgi:flap endonuclease-1